MLDVDNRFCEDQSLLRLDINRDVPGDSLTPLLDVLAKRSRLDFVVDFRMRQSSAIKSIRCFGIKNNMALVEGVFQSFHA